MVQSSSVVTPVLESMTVADVAASLKVVHSTVRKWIDQGVLPAFHPPGYDVVRILRSDFDQFVIKNMTTLPEPPEPELAPPPPARDIVAEGSHRLNRGKNRIPATSAAVPRRRRGRPPGRKNKPRRAEAN